MQSTQPEPGDNDAFFKVVLTLLIVLIPFLHGLRATIAATAPRNKAARLARIDALIAEFSAMLAQLRENAESTSPAVTATPPTHPPAAILSVAPRTSARHTPAHGEIPTPRPHPPKPHAQAPPWRPAPTP